MLLPEITSSIVLSVEVIRQNCLPTWIIHATSLAWQRGGLIGKINRTGVGFWAESVVIGFRPFPGSSVWICPVCRLICTRSAMIMLAISN